MATSHDFKLPPAPAGSLKRKPTVLYAYDEPPPVYMPVWPVALIIGGLTVLLVLFGLFVA